MKSVNVRQLESKLTWPNVTAAVGAKSAVASQFTGSWIRNVRPRGASLIARRRREVLQAAEVNVAGCADKASAAALGIEDSEITVHCGLGSEALRRYQRLLLVLGIQGTQFTAFLDQKRHARRSVSPSQEEETGSCRRKE